MIVLLFIAIAWFIMASAVLALLVQRHRALTPLLLHEGFHADLPRLSVIVPARNEARTIVNCLTDLASSHIARPASTMTSAC